jgi:hypothetical protein
MNAKRQRQLYAEFVRQESARMKEIQFRVIRELDAGRYGVSLTGGEEPDAIVLARAEVRLELGSMARGLLYPEGTEMLHLLRHLPAYRLLGTLIPDGRRRDPEASAQRALEALAAETPFEEWIDSLRRGGATQLTFAKEEKCRECSGWGKVSLPDSAARRGGTVHNGKAGADGKVVCGVCKGKGVIAREVVYNVRY